MPAVFCVCSLTAQLWSARAGGRHCEEVVLPSHMHQSQPVTVTVTVTGSEEELV